MTVKIEIWSKPVLEIEPIRHLYILYHEPDDNQKYIIRGGPESEYEINYDGKLHVIGAGNRIRYHADTDLIHHDYDFNNTHKMITSFTVSNKQLESMLNAGKNINGQHLLYGVVIQNSNTAVYQILKSIQLDDIPLNQHQYYRYPGWGGGLDIPHPLYRKLTPEELNRKLKENDFISFGEVFYVKKNGTTQSVTRESYQQHLRAQLNSLYGGTANDENCLERDTLQKLTHHIIPRIGQDAQRSIQERNPQAQISQRQLAQNISHGFQFLQTLGQAMGSPTLQNVATFGQASYRIISEMSHLSQLVATNSLSASALMSSFSMIGTAGLAIMRLFGRKKSKDNTAQILMQQLRALSEQMAAFRQEVMMQFMQTHYNQRLIYDAVCQGFYLLYVTLHAEFHDLRTSVIDRLENIQGHLTHLEEQIGKGFEELNLQDLLKTVYCIEDLKSQYHNSCATISNKEFKKLIQELRFWLISYETIKARCKSPMLIGTSAILSSINEMQLHDYKRIVDLLRKGSRGGWGQIIGLLFQYVNVLIKNRVMLDTVPADIVLMDVDTDFISGAPLSLSAEILGLRLEPVYGNGHCLFQAVALYLNKDFSTLRNEVADELATKLNANDEQVLSVIKSLLREGQTIDDYVQGIRTTEWADELEIATLMEIYRRPIIVIGPQGEPRNLSSLDLTRYSGDPIFVKFNGHNHYDGLVLKPGVEAKDIFQRLRAPTNLGPPGPNLPQSSKDKWQLFSEPPIHVDVWCFAVQAYIKLRTLGLNSGIVYERSQSELDTLMKEAGRFLDQLKVLQVNGPMIMKALAGHYQHALQALKTKLEQELQAQIDKKTLLLKKDAQAEQNSFLAGALADVHGVFLPLKGATAQPNVIPPLFLLAHQLGLGQIIFRGERSSRISGDVWRHSNHDLGVSLRYPKAQYEIDMTFEFQEPLCNMASIELASGKKLGPHTPQNDFHPGGRDINASNKCDQDYKNTLRTIMQKPLATFLQEHWFKGSDGRAGSAGSKGLGLSFEPQPEVGKKLEKIQPLLEKQIEAHILKNGLHEIVKTDAIQACIVKLDFYHTLLRTYADAIGNFTIDVLKQLDLFKSGTKLQHDLLNYFVNQQNSLTISPSNLLPQEPITTDKVDHPNHDSHGPAHSPLNPVYTEVSSSSPLITLELLCQAVLPAIQLTCFEQDAKLTSPIAIPVLEQISALGALMGKKKEEADDELEEEFSSDCESEDEADKELQSKYSSLIVARKKWRRDKKDAQGPILLGKSNSGSFIYAGTYYPEKSDSSQAKRVAIKTIFESSLQSDQDAKMMFFNEIGNFQKLKEQKSQHVIGFFGVTKHRNKKDKNLSRYSILLERGEASLAECLNQLYQQKGKLTLAEQVKLCLEIARGIQEIHQLKIVHKDLKDTNIVLVSNPNASFGYSVKLIDFGLGEEVQRELSQRSKSVREREGTLSWQAPEVLFGNRHSKESDMYSYALVIWRILHHGSPLFDDNNSNLLPSSVLGLRPFYDSKNSNKRPTIFEQTIDGRLKEIMCSCWLPYVECDPSANSAASLISQPTRLSAAAVVQRLEAQFKQELDGIEQQSSFAEFIKGPKRKHPPEKGNTSSSKRAKTDNDNVEKENSQAKTLSPKK